MKTKLLFPKLAVALTVLLHSCTESPDVQVNSQEEVAHLNDTMVVVNQAGFQFQMSLPKDLLINYEPMISFNEAIGVLEVQLGPSFSFLVAQEKAELTNIKSELSEELLFKNEIVRETESSILFQRILPDGQKFFYQYIQLSTWGSVDYSIRTNIQGEFTLQQVEKMIQCILSIREVESV